MKKQLLIIATALLSGLLMLWAGFPHPLPWLVWIVPVPALLLCLKLPLRSAWWIGLLYGIAINAGYIWQSLHSLGVPVPVVIGFIIASGFVPMLIFGLSRLLSMRSPAAWFPWIFASVHTLLYVTVEHPMTGGHMMPLTASQYKLAAAHAISSVGGPYLLIFILMLGSAMVASLINKRTQAMFFSLGTGIVFAGIIIFAGYSGSAKTISSVRVAAIVPKKQKELALKWSSNHRDSIAANEFYEELSRYEQFSRTAAAGGARIIAWNEYGLRVRNELRDTLHSRIKMLARETGASIIAAYIDADKRTNTAFAVTPSGNEHIYTKAHLVPADESWLKSGKEDFALFTTDDSVKVAVRICYDNDFPGGTRRARQAGAAILVVPAADWKAIAELHIAAQSFRSSENALAILRPASNGISILVDQKGNITQQDTTLTHDSILAGELPVVTTRTVYTVTGNWIFIPCILICILSAIYRVKRNKNAIL